MHLFFSRAARPGFRVFPSEVGTLNTFGVQPHEGNAIKQYSVKVGTTLARRHGQRGFVLFAIAHVTQCHNITGLKGFE